MKSTHLIVTGMMALALLSACSSEEQAQTGDHVFKTQQEALEKARAVEQQLEESMIRQNDVIRQATQ